MAAEQLAAAGVDVQVREARDRIGGRVWTRTLHNGAPVEMGAEFVTQGYELLPATVERLGLSLAPMGMSFSRREPRGGIGTTDEALETAWRAVEAAIAEEADGLSVAQVLDGLDIDAGARELIACRIAVSYAQTADGIAASAVRDIAHLFEPVEARRTDGGNGLIAVGLAEFLDVRTSAPVRSIRHDSAGVSIDGETFVDACVLAAPAHALREVVFDPPLPDWKAAAIARVVYGDASKLFVPLTTPAPPSSVLSVPERFWTWTAKGGSGAVLPVVSAFAGSPEAVDALAGDAFFDRLRALRPDLELDEAHALRSDWPEGAYSTVPPDRPVDDAKLLARAVGRLHFAGEHTEAVWYATMEGALRSGLRAAGEITAAGL
jgi:monoamine oxidase